MLIPKPFPAAATVCGRPNLTLVAEMRLIPLAALLCICIAILFCWCDMTGRHEMG